MEIMYYQSLTSKTSMLHQLQEYVAGIIFSYSLMDCRKLTNLFGINRNDWQRYHSTEIAVDNRSRLCIW